MLTLEFKDQTESGEYFHSGDAIAIRQMHFKFIEPEKELLYMMTANPLLHKRGKIGVSINNSFHGRSLNMDKLKEVLAYSPVGILIKVFNRYFVVGKGFIAMKEHSSSNRGFEYDKLEILFAVTAQVGVQVRDTHDLKIYLNRKLYEPEYKRMMSILKPYMSEHKGDILVTRSVNAHLAYTFQMPVFYNARSRAEFSDLMKELFYRGIYWSSWRKIEDKRLDEEEKIAIAKEKKEKREREIQRQMLEILSAQDLVISEVVQLEEPVVSNITPIFSPELVQEMVDFMPGVAETQNQPTTPPEIYILPTELISQQEQVELMTYQSRRYGHTQRMREAQEELNRQMDTITRQESTPISQEVTPMEPPRYIVLGQMEQSLVVPPDDVPEEVPVDIEMPSDSEHVSDEEMARVLSGFSINPNANIRYSSLLHPITGIPIIGGERANMSNESAEAIAQGFREMAQEGEIDENTEIVITPDGSDNPTEEELDNDPDNYVDAEYEEDRQEQLAVDRELGNIS